MKRILITGVSGFLGYNLFNFLQKRHRLLGTFFRHPLQEAGGAVAPLNLRDEAVVRQVCDGFKPDIIIHTAAVTSPAECREKPETARAINALGTAYVARASARVGSRLIYTSTDRVFDGTRGGYAEEDPPHPLECYGETKLEGEEQVRRFAPGSLILRLPLLYGPPGPFHSSFIGWMIEAFEKGKTLELFTDQFRSPLYVRDACLAIALAIQRPDLTGIYHVGGSDRIDRAAFGFKMAEIFGYDPSVIRPVRMADKPHCPPSPADASLKSERFYRATGFRGRGVTEGLLALQEETARKEQ